MVAGQQEGNLLEIKLTSDVHGSGIIVHLIRRRLYVQCQHKCVTG